MKAHVQKTNRPAEKLATLATRKNAGPCAASAFAQETEALDETSARHDTRRGHDFSRIPAFSKTPVRLQTKLTVNALGDMYEQEADRIADWVTRMSDPERDSATPRKMRAMIATPWNFNPQSKLVQGVP